MGIDFASLLESDEPTAKERMQALASTLQRRRAVGTLASLIGGPAKDFGANLTRSADQDLSQMAELPGQRLQMALQRQKVDEGARRVDPNSPRTQMGLALLQRLGQKAPAGASAADIEATLPLVERASEAEQRGKDRALQRQLAKEKSSGANLLDPATIEMLAQQVRQTGQIPQLGMGGAGAALRATVLNRAAAIDPTTNLAEAKAGFGADSASLKKLQTQADAINAFESTALRNLDTFLEQAKTVVDTGSPWFNKPARELAKGLAGSPNATAFEASRQVAVQEISKVLSGQMGNTAVSDSARHEAASLLSPDASLAQLTRAAEILRRDMANRKESMAAEIATVRGRAGGGGNTPAAAPITSGWDDAAEKRWRELEAKAASGTLK